jgi:hypothetical protein
VQNIPESYFAAALLVSWLIGGATVFAFLTKSKYTPAYRRGYRAALATVPRRSWAYLDFFLVTRFIGEALRLKIEADRTLAEARRLTAHLPFYLQDLSNGKR